MPQFLVQIESADRQLLGRISGALEEAARRSGEWLVCRPGCTQCCIGPFGITQLDAMRLRAGLAVLQSTDPARAAALRARAAEYVAAIATEYPGNRETGELWDEDRLPAFLDDVACPALDPATGRCDLYDARPITCRAFGPATRIGEGTFGACELCYEGATEDQMVACAVDLDPEKLEARLLAGLEAEGMSGMTIVAYALATDSGL
jgi:Fe-S-cluster containining protein